MQTPLLPTLLIFSLLLAGCLKDSTVADRLAWLELTSYSFTSIPQCTSQDLCFAKVQQSFGFDESALNSATRTEMLGAKNHLARSWLFIGNARENLESIHDLCEASNYSGIPKEVNELNSNLTTVGREIDAFNKSAVRALNAELTSMELDDINAIAQEPLFDDYSLLNQNFVDFSSQNAGGRTYASRFIREAEKFNEISQALELEEQLSQTSLFDIVSDNKGTIADRVLEETARKRDFPLWIVSPVFFGISDFLRDFFALGGSIQSLRSLPSFDVLSSINGLMGSDNSAASEFFSIFRNDSLHRAALNEKMRSEKAKANSDTAALEIRVGEISQSLGTIYSPDYQSLGFGYGGFEEFPVSETDPSNFYPAYSARINASKSALREIEEGEFLGTMTLGSRAKKISEISKGNARIAEEIEYFARLSNLALQGCAENLTLAQEQINSEEFRSEDPVIISLKARALSEISDFKGANDLGLCISALRDFKRLSEFLASANPQEEALELFESCIIESEKLVEFAQNADLSSQLEALKAVPTPYSNPELMLDSCNSIRNRLLYEARNSQGQLALSEKFSKLSGYASVIQGLTGRFPNLQNSSRARTFAASFAEISRNFEGTKIKQDSLGKTTEITEKVARLDLDAQEIIKSLASEAVEKYAIIDYPQNPASVLEEGGGKISEYGALARISFESIPQKIPFTFNSTINLRSEKASEVFSTGNIAFTPQGEKTILRFFGLLEGANSIVLDLNAQQGSANQNASSQASNPPPGSAAAKIISDKNSLLGNALRLDAGKKLELDFLGEKVEFLAKQGRLEEAAKELARLRDAYSGAQKVADETLKEMADSYAKKFAQIDSLRESLGKNSQDLLRNFSEVGAAGLELISRFIPITLARANEFSALAKNAVAGEEDFAKLMAKGDYAGAIAIADQSGLDSIISQLEAANSEAQGAISKIKENAISSYELAASRQSGSDEGESAKLLLKSKEALAKKSYLESLLNSTKALEFLPATGLVAAQKFEIPLPIYPLALVALVAGAYAWKKNSPKKPQEPIKVKKAGDEKAEEENSDSDSMLF